jgi:hypothetical protein
MPLPAATSLLSKPKSYLAAQLAACAKWQELCAINGAAASIYFDALPPPPDQAECYTAEQLTALRPLCVIYSDENTGLVLDHQSHGPLGFGYQDSGVVKGYLEIAVDPQLADDAQQAVRVFENDIGQVLTELLALAGQAGYLAISRATFTGPMRNHADARADEGDYFQLHFTFEWGRR